MTAPEAHPAHGVRYRRHAVPSAVATGAACTIAVVVSNTGRTAWRCAPGEAHAIELALYLNGRFCTTGRLPTSTVGPGASECVIVQLAAPSSPGRHELKIDLVEQGVAFFSERGSPPLIVELQVAALTDGPTADTLQQHSAAVRRLAAPGLRRARRRWRLLQLAAAATPWVPALQRRVLVAWKQVNENLAGRERQLGADRLVSRPASIVVDTTSHCNLRCAFCHRQTMHGEPDWVGEMPAPVLDRLIHELFPTARYANLSIVGEPTLSPHLERVFAACARYGTRLSFTTNGTRLRHGDLGRRLAPHLAHLEISVDSLDPVLFALLRAGAELAEVLAAVDYMGTLRREQPATGRFSLGLSATLFAPNLSELPALVRRAARAGCSHLRATFGVVFNERDADWSVFPRAEQYAAVRAEAAAAARELGIALDLPPPFGDETGGATQQQAQTCHHLYEMIRIDHHGAMPACLHSAPPFEVAGRGSFLARWNSPEMRELRQQFRDGAAPAHCRRCYVIRPKDSSAAQERERFCPF